MFKTKRLLLALTIVVSLIAAGCGSDGDETTVALSGNQTSQPPVETSPPVEAAPEDIVDVAISAGDFPTLIAAVQAAGLVETLKSEGPFTVFAPTEAAFAAALATGVTARVENAIMLYANSKSPSSPSNLASTFLITSAWMPPARKKKAGLLCE